MLDGFEPWASGAYDYFCDEELTTVREAFRVFGDSNGDLRWITSDRYAGLLHLQASVALKAGRWSECSVDYRPVGGRTTSLWCSPLAEGVRWRRHRNGLMVDEGLCRGQPLLFPLLRIFMGLVIPEITRQQKILLPDIRTANDETSCLLPYLSDRRAEFLSDDVCTLNGAQFTQQHYCYEGEHYGPDTRVSVAGGLLTGYEWRQQQSEGAKQWRIALRELQATPPFYQHFLSARPRMLTEPGHETP